MACLSLEFLKQLLIWLVVIGAIVALVNLLLPFVLGQLGAAGQVIVQAVRIVMWAVVAIFVIILLFQLIECLFGLSASRLLR